MNSLLDPPAAVPSSSPDGFFTASELAALRAWYQGLHTREAVARYLGGELVASGSSRTVIRHNRRRLGEFARMRSRSDSAELIGHKEAVRAKLARLFSRPSKRRIPARPPYPR